MARTAATTGCLALVASIGAAAGAAADEFQTPVDGLETFYGGFIGDPFEETPFDFGFAFNAVWDPVLLLGGFTDEPGSTLTFTGFMEGEAGPPVEIVSRDGTFHVTVPVPPAVGLLDGHGIVGLQLDTFLEGAADLSSTVTSAVLRVQGIAIVLLPFTGCGTLVPTDECILFESEEGGLYVMSDLGGFGIGDHVHVEGIVDRNCITICLAADSGCIDVASIALCCPADTNGDGTVDVEDLVSVILDFGTDGSGHGGDVDGSGVVDVGDLVEVIVSWGGCRA
jgi:hypothetical protein